MKRTGQLLRKTRLRRLGARHLRDRRALQAFRVAVLERAGGKCERCGKERPLHAHHRRSRAQGGSHEASNGAALCFSCHSKVHDHTARDWMRWIEQRRNAS